MPYLCVLGSLLLTVGRGGQRHILHTSVSPEAGVESAHLNTC